MTINAELPSGPELRGELRIRSRAHALQSALKKRAAGVPSLTVAEAAALCSVSQEHMYRLVRAGAVPSVRMRRGSEQGRYVVPAAVVEELFSAATVSAEPIEVAAWAEEWTGRTGGGR